LIKQLFIASSIASTLAFAGCATMNNPSTDRNLALLQNKTWIVTQINDVKYKADPQQSGVPNLTFDNTQLSGTDGCNRLMGGYAVKGTQITFSEIAKTRRACLSPTNLPDKFTNALNQVTQYKVSETELKLMDSNKNTVLEFKTQR